MELIEALRTTGAVREFTDEPVDDATVHRLLDTARFAPNGGNRQAWRVVVVQRSRRAPGTAGPLPARLVRVPGPGVGRPHPVGGGDRPRRWSAGPWRRPAMPRPPPPGPGGFAEHLDEVPVLLVLLADLERLATVDRDLDHYTLVGGASIYPFAWSILLAARDEGLAGVMTTMVVRDEAAVKELLDVPDTHVVAGVLALGHPVRRPTRLRRDPVAEFATVDRFDGPPLVDG